jgi:hypothetical protein
MGLARSGADGVNSKISGATTGNRGLTLPRRSQRLPGCPKDQPVLDRFTPHELPAKLVPRPIAPDRAFEQARQADEHISREQLDAGADFVRRLVGRFAA